MQFSRKDNVKKLCTLHNGDVFIFHADIKESSPKVYMKVITNDEDVAGFHILDMSEGKVYLNINDTSDLVIHYPKPQLKLR